MFAAVKGSIAPMLFTPSVTKMMTLLLLFESFIRLIAVAKPSPMAVPSSISPLSVAESSCSKMLWSIVEGHFVYASPAKTTIPMLSLVRALIKRSITLFADSNRFGLKSSASMEVETSKAKTMSIPSMLFSSFEKWVWGRAIATIKTATAKYLKISGRRRRRSLNVFLAPSNWEVSE